MPQRHVGAESASARVGCEERLVVAVQDERRARGRLRQEIVPVALGQAEAAPIGLGVAPRNRRQREDYERRGRASPPDRRRFSREKRRPAAREERARGDEGCQERRYLCQVLRVGREAEQHHERRRNRERREEERSARASHATRQESRDQKSRSDPPERGEDDSAHSGEAVDRLVEAEGILRKPAVRSPEHIVGKPGDAAHVGPGERGSGAPTDRDDEGHGPSSRRPRGGAHRAHPPEASLARPREHPDGEHERGKEKSLVRHQGKPRGEEEERLVAIARPESPGAAREQGEEEENRGRERVDLGFDGGTPDHGRGREERGRDRGGRRAQTRPAGPRPRESPRRGARGGARARSREDGEFQGRALPGSARRHHRRPRSERA